MMKKNRNHTNWDWCFHMICKTLIKLKLKWTAVKTKVRNKEPEIINKTYNFPPEDIWTKWKWGVGEGSRWVRIIDMELDQTNGKGVVKMQVWGKLHSNITNQLYEIWSNYLFLRYPLSYFLLDHGGKFSFFPLFSSLSPWKPPQKHCGDSHGQTLLSHQMWVHAWYHAFRFPFEHTLLVGRRKRINYCWHENENDTGWDHLANQHEDGQEEKYHWLHARDCAE